MTDIYDVVIIGGGITGTSLLYAISEYSDIKSVLLLEKYDGLARLNSNSRNNAQTLHFGDVETNYTPQTAKRTKEAAELVLRYTDSLPDAERRRIIQRCQKMVLASGDFELGILEKTYKSIRPLFPGLKRVGRKQLAALEPNVVKGRDKDDEIAALLSDNGHMVDFGRLTKSFANKAMKHTRKRIRIKFNTAVLRAEHDGDNFRVVTAGKEYRARFVVFSAGAYSLYFAKKMGYDKNLSALAVAGNFYYSKRVLNGKVYRVQLGGIPFAAIHGDPEITNPGLTRFGPTVTLPPELERGHFETFGDYLRTFDFDLPTAISLKRILFNKDISRILRANIAYLVPISGKMEFVKHEAARIVPSLKNRDLWLAKGIGGIRPQIIDENKKALILGEAKLKEDGIIFNVTPSPGASSCLQGAVADLRVITEYLDKEFDEGRFERELGEVKHHLRHF